MSQQRHAKPARPMMGGARSRPSFRGAVGLENGSKLVYAARIAKSTWLMTSHNPTSPGRAEDVLAGGGELGMRMREIDWSKTPLGPVALWPQSLKTCVRIILTSRQPMFVWWGDQLTNLYNDAYKAILGGKHPDALGQAASQVWREIWDEVGPRAAAAIRGNEGTYDEALLLIMERNGYPEETYYTFSYSPVPNDLGGTGGIICANTDDTQRIIGERQIALLREQAAGTLHARTIEGACQQSAWALETNARDIPFALIYLADNGHFSLTAVSGIERGHAAAPEVIAARGPALWPLAEVLETQQPCLVEIDSSFGELPVRGWNRPPSRATVLPIARPGETGPAGAIVVGLNPFRLFDGGYQSFLSLVVSQISSSIGSAHAYEQEKKRREAMAELDRAKTIFFSNVSHEFRTPLTLMLAPIEDMRSSETLDPNGRKHIELLHRNALRLLKLVNNLLDFSRIEAGRLDAVYEPTDLAALTADLASMFRSALERAGLNLVVDCPPLARPIYVDTGMWEKIVLNLLSNALKFTFDGSVTVRLRAIDDSAELEVNDTGTGIPERELPRLFERFHRVEGARSRSHEGSGIGLALVHELVRMHGGGITVESREGHGTTFRVRIPQGTAHLVPERIRAARSASMTTPAARAYVEEALQWGASNPVNVPLTLGARGATTARILVADDNADMREYVARLLAEHWQVETVRDGVEAVAAIRRRPPDLVLSDVMMPRLDGVGLLKVVRSDPALRAMPFILLSARAGEEATTEGLAAGADDYIVKPFTARDLLVRIAARLATARDAREMDEQRKRERLRLLTMLEQVPANVNFLSGTDLVFEFAHPRTIKTFGGRPLLGKRVVEAIPEMRDQPYVARLRRVVETGEPFFQHEAPVLVQNGDEEFVSYWNSVYVPIADDVGQIEGVMTFDIDVTQTVLARRELEASSRAKDEFLATMSHELRTPLNAILGWASILSKNALDRAKLQQGLLVIERNAQAQARLVSDLLDVSRIIAGKLRLTLRRADIARVVRATADIIQPAADAKRVRLVLDIDPGIGEAIADPDRLQQVVWNLLSNAVRFTPSDGRITVTARRSESGITIRVDDTGAGIAQEHLPYLFERFRQVDSSTTRSHGGLGLGLAIVRHLVEAHGGNVVARSDGVGSGSSFTVTLPVRAVTADAECVDSDGAPRAATAAPATSEGGAPLRNLRLLIIDDEPDSLDLLRVVLEGAGADVTTASSAREALDARGPFDLVISDIGMPDMDGYAFVRRLRSTGAKTPAIALTAYARAEDGARALGAGYQQHLAKPIDAAKLVEAVREWASPVPN